MFLGYLEGGQISEWECKPTTHIKMPTGGPLGGPQRGVLDSFFEAAIFFLRGHGPRNAYAVFASLFKEGCRMSFLDGFDEIHDFLLLVLTSEAANLIMCNNMDKKSESHGSITLRNG